MSKENDDLAAAIFVEGRERDPLRAVKEGGKPKVLKRFYAQASAAPRDGAFAVLLDGKPLRTPARGLLRAPTQALAAAIAAEWAGQRESIDSAAMPLTRIANSAIDGVAPAMAEVAADAAKYAGSDLLCYRAGEPESLARAQSAAWDPLLAFVREKCGARFVLSEGVTFHAQPEESLRALRSWLDATVGEGEGAPFRLAGLHTMTTLTGSVFVALAVTTGFVDAEAGFSAAHVDEDHQMRVWGADAEALARRARRLEEMRAAAQTARLAG